MDGKYPKRIYNSDDDVYEVVDILIEDYKNQGSEGSMPMNISSHLPFFSCTNVFLNKSCQNDIGRYMYSKDYAISPYPGTYGCQPNIWKIKHFLIKSSCDELEKKAMKKNQGEANG